MGTYDNLFTKLIEDPDRAGRMLRALLPPDLTANLDDTSPPDVVAGKIAVTSEHHVLCDGVFEFKLKDPRKGKFRILLEHKSQSERNAPRQLLIYIDALLVRNKAEDAGETSRWDPIYPVVVYGSAKKWKAGQSIYDWSTVVESQGRSSLGIWYLLVDLARIDIGSLDLEVESVSALQILALNSTGSDHISDVALDRIARGFTRTELGMYISKNIFDLIEMKPTRMEAAEERVKPKGEERQMPTLGMEYAMRGREEGMQQGMLNGRAQALLDLLMLKFKNVPEKYRQRVLRAGLEEIVAWTAAVLTATSIEDVFASQSSA